MTPLYVLIRFCLFALHRLCDWRAWVVGRRYELHTSRIEELAGRLTGLHTVDTPAAPGLMADRLAKNCRDQAELGGLKARADRAMASFMSWTSRTECLSRWALWLRRTPGPVGSMAMAWADALGTAALFTMTSGFDPLSLGIDATAALADAWDAALIFNESPLCAAGAKVVAAAASLTLFVIPLIRIRWGAKK